MKFEWDESKAQANLQKHGVDFEIARTVFTDPFRVTYVDDRSDYKEQRFITTGLIGIRHHVIIYAKRNDAIRIISARKANKREQKFYADCQNYH